MPEPRDEAAPLVVLTFNDWATLACFVMALVLLGQALG